MCGCEIAGAMCNCARPIPIERQTLQLSELVDGNVFCFSMSKAGLTCSPCRAIVRSWHGRRMAHEHDVLNSRQFGVVRVSTAHLRLAEFLALASASFLVVALAMCAAASPQMQWFRGRDVVQALTNAKPPHRAR